MIILLIEFIIPYPEIENGSYYGEFIDFVYNSLKRNIFTIGLIIVLIPPIFITEKYMHLLLGNQIVSILANLTYTIYLIHFIIVCYIHSCRTKEFSLSDSYLFLKTI